MKKNILLIALLFLTMFIFVGCKNDKIKDINGCEQAFNDSFSQVKGMTSEMTMTDNNVVVYKYTKTITIESENETTITEETSKLVDFELLTTSSTEREGKINLDKLKFFNFDVNNFKSYDINDNSLTIKVSGDKFSNVLNNVIYLLDGEATIIITYENMMVKEVNISFMTESNKQVNIRNIYSY